jgi:hypothetical protein
MERPKTDPTRTAPAEPEPGRLARRLQSLFKRAVDAILGSDWTTGALFVGAFTLVFSLQQCAPAVPAYAEGEIARVDVIAPADLTVPARQETENRRAEERARVLPVYNLDAALLDRSADLIGSLFETGRAFLAQRPGGGEPTGAEREALRRRLPVPIAAAAFDDLLADGFSAGLEAALLAAFEPVRREKVVDNPLPLLGAPAIRVRELRAGGDVEIAFDRPDAVLGLEAARDRVARSLRDALPRRDAGVLAEFLQTLVNPNLVFDAGETERRRAAAAARVQPLVTTIPRGTAVVKAGEPIGAEQILFLDALRRTQGARVGATVPLGYGGLGLLLALLLWRYVGFVRSEEKTDNLFGMSAVVALGMLLLCAVLLLLGRTIAGDAPAPFDRASSYGYAVPVAAGAMLMTLLARPRPAMVLAALLSAVFGMLSGWDMTAALFGLVSGITGIYAITQYKQRTAIIKAGLVVGGVNSLAVLALAAIGGRLQPLEALLFDMACGVAGGVLVAIVVSFTLPVLEWMFNVLTDIRLLELSNLNSPLLRKLAVRAPGTYNHSVIVGTLAEAAAQAIGGNSLLCRVAAYYHDVGKMSKPEYFIENQMEATERHDRLAPTMSSLIIASHVKDGIKLAKEYNLPQPIVDIIPQHHGTRLITYFYKKAKRREISEIQEVSESSFRYPGPRPQSKEAAIFMMADSVEAAARTVDEPTPAKFKDVIRKIVNAVILDDQLTETDLTFQDLDRIQESFLKTLTSIYHHRIEYPGFKFEDRPGRDRVQLPG